MIKYLHTFLVYVSRYVNKCISFAYIYLRQLNIIILLSRIDINYNIMYNICLYFTNGSRALALLNIILLLGTY